MSTAGERGRFGEGYVRSYLERGGYRIITSNFRVKGGEIDIICEKDGVLVFTEVKTRKFGALSDGMDAITPAKRARIVYAAQRFIDERQELSFESVRFDAAILDISTEKYPTVLEMRYFEDAFQPE